MTNTDDLSKTTPAEGGDASSPVAPSAAGEADSQAPAAAAASARGTAGSGIAVTSFDEDIDPEEHARLAAMYESSFRNISEGEVIKGTVLQVSSSEVIVDVGYKSEGIISLSEFLDENGEVIVQPGDTVDVLLDRTEDRDGHIVLSREKAEKMKIWDEVEKAYNDRKVVIGHVIERIKGGLAVDIGVRAFLPGSQIDVRPVRNLDSLRGQELRMRVIKVNKKRGNIVLSRKVLIEEENAEKKKETLANLAEGKVMLGVVKNITDYGAFIDLGGIDGLLHVTDMSWGRAQHPSELFKVNDECEVIVLKFDPETERVSLGYKQLHADPWTSATDQYPVGQRVSGKVVSLTDYGAFVELEPGVEGLIHVSEMSWSKRVKHPSKLLNGGGHRRVDGARGRPRSPSNLARSEADRGQPLARARREVSGGLAASRQGAQPDGVRGVRRGRGRDRRSHPHLRHVVEQAPPASVGGAEEGRRGRGDGAQPRCREPAAVARVSSSWPPTSGTTSSPTTRSGTSSRARSSA